MALTGTTVQASLMRFTYLSIIGSYRSAVPDETAPEWIPGVHC
jgi:hypothetical protein